MTTYRFVETNKASVDTLFGLASEAFAGVEQLAALNLQAIKATLAEFEQGTEAAFAAKSPADLLKLQAAALQAAPQKATAYGRQVKEIFAAATAASASASLDDENSPTTSLGRMGLTLVYVSPEDAGTHAPPT